MKTKTKAERISCAALAAVLMVAGYALFAMSTSANAALSTDSAANVVIGQPDMTSNAPNHGISPVETAADQLYLPRAPFFDGTRYFVVDMANNRVLIYNSIPTVNGASADVVIGQPNMTSNGDNQGGDPAANTLSSPSAVFSDGTKLIICDSANNRVLIYNSIPTVNGASADVVIGQPDMVSNSTNQGLAVAANSMFSPTSLYFDGKKLIVSDWDNNRVLIFNSLPTVNNASADVVLGQPNMGSNAANRGGSVAANTLSSPNGVWANGKKFFIADQYNHRVLIYNAVPTVNGASADVVIGQPDMVSNGENQGGAAAAANTMLYPTHIFPYGPKLLVIDAANNRLLVFNAIPTANGASADVVIGQPDMASNSANQGGTVAANTLFNSRGVFVTDSKLMIGDLENNRVLLYDSFGAQWAIGNNHGQTLSGGEKISVKKNKLTFSGKKAMWKKGSVKIYRDGRYIKKAKIKKNGKWSLNFKDKGSHTEDFVIKYYDSHSELQMNSETYTLGIRTGASALTLEKTGSIGTENAASVRNPENQGKFKNSKVKGTDR